jgi:hypothetical protein
VTERSTGKPARTEKTTDNAEPGNEFHNAIWSQGSMGSKNGHPSVIRVPPETAFTTVSAPSQGSCSSASNGSWKADAGPEASALAWQMPTPTQGKHQLQLTSATLRDVLLSPVAVDPIAITALIQSSTMSSKVSLMKPLSPLITALFDAALLIDTNPLTMIPNHHGAPDLRSLVLRFGEICRAMPYRIVHGGAVGPEAGSRALQMQLRRSSVWTAHLDSVHSSTTSLSDEMARINTDRQRRKHYILWAKLHAVALELGLLSPGRGVHATEGPASAVTDKFSECMVHDLAYESDEVEWVAGTLILRGIVLSASRSQDSTKSRFEELIKVYEERLKEVKDEIRQNMMIEALLAIKENISR